MFEGRSPSSKSKTSPQHSPYYNFRTPVPTPNPSSNPHFPVFHQVPLEHSLSSPSSPLQPNSLAHFFKPLTSPYQLPISRLIALPRSRDIRPKSPARELACPLARYMTPITHFCRSRLVATSILHLFGNVDRPSVLALAKVQHRETYLFCPVPLRPAVTKLYCNLVP